MSFRFDVGAKSRKAARFITKVRNELLKALSEERESRGLNQQQIASLIGVNRSVVSRQFSGQANLTLRSVADIAYALDRDIEFSLPKRSAKSLGNYFVTADQVATVPAGRRPLETTNVQQHPSYAPASSAKSASNTSISIMSE